MANNINTKEYWDDRFSSGNWVERGGRWQTKSFAEGQIPHLDIAHDFDGTILDFGCGLGDSIPVYSAHYPLAKLYGTDISDSAIKICRQQFGSKAEFFQGDHDSIPAVDVIIASNVLEHISNDDEVVRRLLSRCKDLYVIVPYKEWPLDVEHINTYDETCFSNFSNYTYKIFPCKGWSQYGFNLWYRIYFKNIIKFILGRKTAHRGMQIMFHFKGSLHYDASN